MRLLVRVEFLALLLFSILISLDSRAQYPVSPNLLDENGKRTGHWTIWYDSNFNFVHDPDSLFYYRVLKFEAGVPVGKIRDFSKTGYKFWDGFAKSIDPYVFDGESNSYHENGRLKYRQIYVAGSREGPCAEYYVNGQLQSEGQFLDNKADGLWKYYHENGAKKIELTYKADNKTGPAKFYHPTGAVEAAGSYKDNLTEGTWLKFSDTGTKTSFMTYKKDTLDGLQENYYPDGSISEKYFYVKGLTHGPYATYHENGQVKSKGKFVNDQREGAWVYYHPNGKVSSRGDRKNGLQEGDWEFFYDNGQVSDKGVLGASLYQGEWNFWFEDGTKRKTANYKNDTLNGKYIEYHANGKKKTQGFNENGLKTGLWLTYNDSGILIDEGAYSNGLEVGTWKFYYDSGEFKTMSFYKDGNLEGLHANYYQSGPIKEHAYYVHGELDSIYRSYFENGQLNAEGNFGNGMKQGDWKWHYTNGVVSGTSFFVDDKENGPMTTVFENGILGTKGVRKNDVMSGPVTFYFMDGKISQQGQYIDGLFDGKWLFYDSATGQLQSESNFSRGKKHGKAIAYNAKGKPEQAFYYIHGFAETVGNIRDSIMHLINIRDYDKAMKAVSWMESVEKRESKRPIDRLLSIHMRGRVYSAKEDYKAAIPLDKKYMEAIGKYEGKQSANYRVAVHNYASAVHGVGHYDEALKYYDVAIAIAKADGLVSTYWSTVNNKAYCLYDAGKHEEAYSLFSDELTRSVVKYGTDSSAGWYLRHEAAEFYYNRVKDYDVSLKMFSELLEDINKSEDRNNLFAFNCNNRIGDINYNKLDKDQDAVKPYTEAASYAEKNGMTDLPSYASIMVDLFYLSSATRKDSLGIENEKVIVSKLKKLAETCPDPKSVAEVLLALGNDFYNRDIYAEAYSYFHRSEQAFILAGMKNTMRHASVLQSLAFSLYYSDRRQVDQAEQYFLHAMTIRKELNERTSVSYYGPLRQLASFYSTIEKYDTAIEFFNDVKKIALEVNDNHAIAKSNQSLGEIYFNMWQYNTAIQHLKDAIVFYEKHENEYPDYYISSLAYMSACYKVKGEYDDAIVHAKHGLALAERYHGNKSSSYMYRLAGLGSIYERNSLYSEALKYYTEAATGMKNLYGETSTAYITEQSNVISIWFEMKEYKKVIAAGDPLLALIIKEYGEQSDSYLGFVHIVAQAYSYLDSQAIAEKYLLSAVTSSKALNGSGSSTTAAIISRLGKFYNKLNRTEEAEKAFAEAASIMKASSLGKSSAVSSYLVDLADVLHEQDKNKEAEELYNEGFAITHQDTLNTITTYVSAGEQLADFYNSMGRFKEAAKLTKRLSLAVENSYGRKYYYASVREALVYIYSRQGENDAAEKEAIELLDILAEETSPDHWLVLNLHNYLGIIYDHGHKFQKSSDEFNLCIAALLRKKTLTTIEQGSLATFYNNAGRIDLCLGNYEDGYKKFMECERLRKAAGEVMGQISVANFQSNLASYYQQSGKMDKAEATWQGLNKSLLSFSQNNFYFMSDEEKAQFWKNIYSYFGVFQSFAVQRAQKNPAIVGDMYNVQLATKAILLSASNKIRKRILSSRDTLMVNMYYRWTKKKEELAQLYSSGKSDANQKAKIDSLEIAAKNLEKEMNISAEDVSKDRGGDAVTWKNVQMSLAPDEAAVEIVRFNYYNRYQRDSVIYAALVLTSETRQAPKLIVLKDGSQLEGRFLKYYRNSIASKTVDSISYREYWSPLTTALKGKSRIYLSLDGVYNQINLNTLMNKKGEYLVDDKNLTILSNTKDLLAIKSRKVKRISLSSATLFGFPTYFLGKDHTQPAVGTTRDFDANAMEQDRTGISPLLGTKAEIQKVGSILESHKMKANVYTSEMASEHQIKQLQHPRVLHIATHGFFVEEQGSSLATAIGSEANPLLRAGLLLAGASNFIQSHERVDEENGILTAYEAANLDLDNTDLVVLSACETGKGEVQNGEGVYGLQRAFQTAGAQTIVMSLWKVDDNATQQLMTSFYTNWMGGMTKAAALKTAQVELKKQYPHPYYWGAFVMLEN